MGRIRGKWVKNLSKKLVEKYPDRFGSNFEENKKTIEGMNILGDKPIRNKVAGYMVEATQKKKIA
jgi:small subunit ribosomal protein S17e